MVNYNGMLLPGRVPGHRDKVMVLPSDITKLHAYTKYRDACLNNGWTAAGRSKVCLHFMMSGRVCYFTFLLPSLPLIFALHVSRTA